MKYGSIATMLIVSSVSACEIKTMETTSPAAEASTVLPITASQMGNDECPASTFEEFLKRYASDELVRDTFTMPTVSVVDFKNPDEPVEGTKIIGVPKEQYEGFDLVHRDDGFHVVDSAGGVDPNPVDVSVGKKGTDEYVVSYQYGMSEGGSYLFKKHGSCWILFGEPNPPSP